MIFCFYTLGTKIVFKRKHGKKMNSFKRGGIFWIIGIYSKGSYNKIQNMTVLILFNCATLSKKRVLSGFYTIYRVYFIHLRQI